MSLDICQLTDEKHEIYFTNGDYRRLYEKYHKGNLDHKNNPYRLLLCAKACFFMGRYEQCIKTISLVRIDYSTKILYERQCLLLKVTSLHNPDDAQKIQSISSDFQFYKKKCPGLKIEWFHESDLKILKQTALKAQQLRKQENYQLLDKKQLYDKLKQLKKCPAFEGMPCYLVSKQWQYAFNKYLNSQEAQHPGPITNFQLMNHIFEFKKQPNKNKIYMDTLLFSLQEGVDYSVLTKDYWRQLLKAFDGYPIQRIYVKDLAYKSMVLGDNLIKTLLQFQDRTYILQWQAGTFWERSVFQNLMKLFGKGQLKQQTKNKQFLIVQPGLISQPSSKLKYVLVDHEKIMGETPTEKVRKDKILMSYDLEQYSLIDSKSNGMVGLVNLGNTCYMNSALQCLSHITNFSRFFVENNYLEKLNLSDNNKHGSYGEVTCALADIFKRLWFCSAQTRYIDPTPFKRVFGERFQDFDGNDQQDAQQFLMFLLNCIHDDLNERSNMKLNRESTTNRKFDEVKQNTLKHFQKHNKSIITENFTGFHSQNITCHECNSQTYKFEDFMMFHVQVPPDTPKLELYFVSYNKKSQPATKIEIYLEMLDKYEQLQQLLRNELSISQENKIYAFLMSTQFKISVEVYSDYLIKDLYEKTTQLKNSYYFFVYEVRNIYKQEQLALITFTYDDGIMGRDCSADGFPRIIPIQSKLKQKDNRQDLKEIIVDSIPLAIFQSSKEKAIGNFTIKNSKGTTYTQIVSVKTVEKLRMFKYNPYKRILGKKIRDQQISLESCLATMSEKELIKQQEAWSCDKCKQIRAAYKADKIFSTNQILLFDFKRFTERGKIATKISYPVTKFNISPFLQSKSSKMLYNLVGVILHRGSLNYGHYTAYCWDENSMKWYHFDDEYYREVDIETVVDQNAYILMYKKL